MVGNKTRCHHARQLRHLSPDALHPFLGNHQRRQIRVRKITVVRSVFLAAHGAGLAAVRVEQHGGLLDRVAVFDLLDLPQHLKVDGLLHELETVQVLDLAPCAQRGAGPAHRHVGIAAKTTLLHVAVANADPAHDLVQFAGIGHGFGAGAHVGLGHDLQQRRAGAIEVDTTHADKILVQRFPGVLLQMGTHQSHRPLLTVQEEFDCATLHHRYLELADLVTLGQVRIEIVLARKHAAWRDVGPDGQSKPDRPLYRAPVHYRQCSGQGQINGAGLGVGLGAKSRGCATENLRSGGELGVGFKTNDDFVPAHQGANLRRRGGCRVACHGQNPGGLRLWWSVTCWNWCAMASSRASCR